MASATDQTATGANPLAEFAVLPLQYPPLPSYPHKTTHHLYIRPHAPRIPTITDDRALFLANVPVDATESRLKALFASRLGNVRITHVDFDEARASKSKHKPDHTAASAPAPAPTPRGKKRKRAKHADANADADLDAPLSTGLPETWDRSLHASGSSAVAVFVDRASRDAAWKAVRRAAKGGKNAPEIVWGGDVDVDGDGEGVGDDDSGPPLGSQRYRAHYDASFPDPERLQSSVETYMAAFTARESAETRKRARQRAEPDADGFITVVRGGRAGPARLDEAQQVLRKQKERDAEKAEDRGNFYRFQVREQRKEKQRELVRKFDEDRKLVESMRAEKEGVFVPT